MKGRTEKRAKVQTYSEYHSSLYKETLLMNHVIRSIEKEIRWRGGEKFWRKNPHATTDQLRDAENAAWYGFCVKHAPKSIIRAATSQALRFYDSGS